MNHTARAISRPSSALHKMPASSFARGARTGAHLGQDQTVLGWLQGWEVPLMALGFTAGKHPRHPLYVKGDQNLVAFGG